jgi:hypothetical protein
VEATVAGTPGHRTAFVQVRQGQMTWLAPVEFEVRPPYEIIEAARQPADGVTFFVRNNTAEPFEGQAVIASGDGSINKPLTMAAFGDSNAVTLSAQQFHVLPGTIRITVAPGEDKHIEGVVTNWNIGVKERSVKWETVDLKSVFNDKVTQIFGMSMCRRVAVLFAGDSQTGIGSWCNFNKTFDVDDSACAGWLAKAAGKSNCAGHSVRVAGDGTAATSPSRRNGIIYRRIFPSGLRAGHGICICCWAARPTRCRADLTMARLS